MKKAIKIAAATTLFVGIFALAASASYLLLQDQKLPTNATELRSTAAGIKNKLPRAYVVQSGSMEPAIMTGSLIISMPQNNYRSGQVITFEKGNKLITHRAMYQEFTLDDSYFITKGDANEETDTQQVAESAIVGKVVFSMPYVGYVADFAKTPKGFILLVIVPATIVIYEELKSLFKELLKVIKRMKEYATSKTSSSSRPERRDLANGVSDTNDTSRKGTGFLDSANASLEMTEESNRDGDTGNGKIIKSFAIFPIFGAILVVSAFSVSYFFDNETTVDNVFSASNDFGPSPTPTGGVEPQLTPTPTPTEVPFQGLVINEVLPNTTCEAGNTEAQWIEIYNGTGSTVNPKDFLITDGTNIVDLVTAASLSINPNEFLLLAHNNSIWGTNQNNCWDDNGVQTGNLGGTLNIDTGLLQLVDPQGTTQDTSDDIVIDTVRWGETETHDPQQEESIEREPDGKDNAFGTNFDANDFVVRPTPAPGT